MNLASELRGLGEPIRVGVVGCGIFGSQVIHAIEATPGMRTAVVGDVVPEKAVATLRRAGVPEDEIHGVADGVEAGEVVRDGGRAVVPSGEAVIGAGVDVVVEATGDPNAAARHIVRALVAGVDVVNVTVEADTVCGVVFARLAGLSGAAYSFAYGDQPAQIVGLCEWAGAAGFDLVAAGKASREHDPHGLPDDAVERHGRIRSFGEGLDPNPRMYNTFLDGTKTAVESVAAANALDLGIDTTGLHHPTVPVAEVPTVFRSSGEGGVLGRLGVVDTVTPTDGGFSVFVVTRTASAQLVEYFGGRSNVVSSDDGVTQVFTRPFHFAPETTVSVASVAVSGEPTGAPRVHSGEVVGAAKRPLEPGETVDGGGGYTVYGVAADAAEGAANEWVPFELLAGAEVTRPVDQDAVITQEDVVVDTSQPLYHLRAFQDLIT